MAKLFLLLSGEHESLPISEAKAIFEAEGFSYKISEKLDQVLRLEADPACVEALRRRAAFTRVCAFELFNCNSETSSIIRAARHTSFAELIKHSESFVVRVKHVKEYSSKINGMALERTLGAIIADKCPTAKAKMNTPQKAFLGVLTGDRFIFGLKLAGIQAKPFVERRPRKRPFFHPSAMQAKLARCMVNLARPNVGKAVLDPFCGTGTVLIEAKLIGCKAYGLDVQHRMVKGTLRNMTFFNVEPEGVIIADAKDPPLTRVDCVVTDPPYGISSTTLKRTTKQIIEEALRSIHEMLNSGSRICMAAPKKLGLMETGTKLGYKHLQSHFVYVHRSLTREVVVFERA